MNSQRGFRRLERQILVLVGVILIVAVRGQAQDRRGIIFNLILGGSSGTPGQVFRLHDAVGYRFNEHFEIDAGLPVYFVRVSSTGLAQGFSSHNGIGNAFLQLRGVVNSGDWYFSSNLKGTAPTGNTDFGFSTGRATVDWTNYFQKTIGRFSPFGAAGIANTISDTHFFIRPFTSLGFVSHFEGGVDVSILGPMSIGGSLYADVPRGRQKVFSKLLPRGQGGSMGMGRGAGHGRAFETQSAVVGGTETDKDHGASAWLDFTPATNVLFEIGYSRSMQYDLDTVFFSVGFALDSLVKKAIH